MLLTLMAENKTGHYDSGADHKAFAKNLRQWFCCPQRPRSGGGQRGFLAPSGSSGVGKSTTNGVINGIFARRFDDASMIPAFFLTPMTYLVGVFYSTDIPPEFCQRVSDGQPYSLSGEYFPLWTSGTG